MNDNFYQNDFTRTIKFHKKNIRKHSIRIGACILLFLTAPLFLSLGLGITGLFTKYSESLILQYCIEMFLMVAFLFVPFFAVYLFADKSSKKSILLSLEKPTSPTLFLLSIPFGLMLCFAGDYVSSVISTVFESIGITLTSVPEYEIPTSGPELFLFAFSTIVPPAIIEEFALRSVTMQPLRKYGDIWAIVMTALVFGLMHRNAVQGIFAFIAGVVFGYITVATNSIWPAVIVHALNNGFSVLLNVLMEINEETANNVYALIMSIVLVSGILSAVLFFVIGERNKPKNNIPFLPLKEKCKSFFINIPMVISFIAMILYTVFGDFNG